MLSLELALDMVHPELVVGGDTSVLSSQKVSLPVVEGLLEAVEVDWLE